MNLLNIHQNHIHYHCHPQKPLSSRNFQTTRLSSCRFLSPPAHIPKLSLTSNSLSASTLSLSLLEFKFIKFKHDIRVSETETPFYANVEDGEKKSNLSTEFEDLASEGEVYKKTLRLVECSMFAAVSGLAYFLSNSLAIENYFGCFLGLPIVISSMRWGVAAGRKTMVATALLLFVLSGPVKALTYLLMHGLVGFTMGSMWRLRASWGVSIFFCSFVVFASLLQLILTICSPYFCWFGANFQHGHYFDLQVRAMGAMGYVLISSFLIRENILALITINIHASLTFILTSLGIQTIPSMDMIYALFGTLLLLNCGSFVFLLHLLYAVFFVRLGMKASLRLPRWLEKAI